ncbi:unnamed protein product [Psylliodes chrysocephalus]|uniref:Uncharacterized protein n=1 Tax=Psylliodes chrysocephalus TaxID=3402493 RepID=A0A9P0D8Z5_9CUCU|nr:unnamed protein product [Psylliodes chrysocephala]
MSGTDSEQKGSEDVTSEMMFIAERVVAFPEILEKSQIPAMKTKKTAALTQIVKEYVTLFDKEMEIKAFMKKVRNTFMSTISTYLLCIFLLGALAIGVPTEPTLSDGILTESDAHQMTGVVPDKKRSYISAAAKKLAPKPTFVREKPEESDKTRQLTTTQLQRLVLVEQLKVARLQQQYFFAKLQKLDETSNKEPSKWYVDVGDKTYCNL